MSDSLLKISGGYVYDPLHGLDGQVRDVWIEGGKIVAPPDDPTVRPARTLNASGLVVMPGGVDMHCHIAGPKVNMARKMRPEDRRLARTGLADRQHAQRHDGERAQHVRHRLQVRGHGIHHGLRRRRAAPLRAARS